MACRYGPSLLPWWQRNIIWPGTVMHCAVCRHCHRFLPWLDWLVQGYGRPCPACGADANTWRPHWLRWTPTAVCWQPRTWTRGRWIDVLPTTVSDVRKLRG